MTLTGPFAVSVKIVIFSLLFILFIILLLLLLLLLFLFIFFFFSYFIVFIIVLPIVVRCCFCRISILTVFSFLRFFVSTILVNKLVCLSVIYLISHEHGPDAGRCFLAAWAVSKSVDWC